MPLPAISTTLSSAGKLAKLASSLLATLYLPVALVMLGGLAVATTLLISTTNYLTESLVRQSLLASATSGEREVSQQIRLTRLTLKAMVPETQFLQKDGSPLVAFFPEKHREIEARLWQALSVDNASEHFVRYADVNGNFLGLRRIQEGVYQMRHQGAPAASRTLLPDVQFQQVEVGSHYDARELPWYQQAAARKTPVWSPVFHDYVSGRTTLALSQAVFSQADGTLRGVISTNLSLPALESALRKLPVGKMGWIFILDEQSRLVASSWGQKIMPAPDSTALSQPTLESRIPAVRVALRSFLTMPTEKKAMQEDTALIRFEVDDQRMWASIHTIHDDAGPQWRIGVVLPESELQAPFSQWLSKALSVAGLVMLTIVLLAAWPFYRTLKDFRRLQIAVGATRFGEPIKRLPTESSSALGILSKSIQSINERIRTDPLTGVFNREAMVLFAKNCIARVRAGDTVRCAMLFLDLDKFKRINDELGHQAGDKTLQIIARRLQEAVGEGDMVSRFGGDEFVICLGQVQSEQEVQKIADQIKASISAPIDLGDDGEHIVTVAIGSACYPLDGNDFDTLGAKADQRMLEQKRRDKVADTRYFRHASAEK